MKIIKDNLINLARKGEVDVMIHGCNCFNTMGSGIAKSVKQAFPEAYAADKKTRRGDTSKLGTITSVTVIRNNRSVHIVNAYTQYRYDAKVPQLDYQALRRCFMAVKAKYSGKVIAYPKIGSSLAGGDWLKIATIIDEVLAGEEHFCVSLTGD